MADNLPDAMETILLDYFLHTTGSTTWAAPASLWVGLCSAAPTETVTNECTVANNYNRVQIGFSPAVAGQATGPSAVATFSSASGSWGTINGYIICEASIGSAGSNWLAYGAVSPTVAVTTNDTVSFATGAMSLTFA
jgi:hypothetical protein